MWQQRSAEQQRNHATVIDPKQTIICRENREEVSRAREKERADWIRAANCWSRALRLVGILGQTVGGSDNSSSLHRGGRETTTPS